MKRFLELFLVLILMCTTPVFATQSVVSIPSSDVLPAGEIILKDSNRFTPWHESFVSLTPSLIVGTGKGTEMSVGVGTTIRDTTSVKMDIGAKKVFKMGKAARFTVGGKISPSLTEGKNPNSMLYAHSSYLIKQTKTTLTSGVYVSGYESMPDSTGALLGIDQTIIPNKFRVVADWMSRSDSGCALSAGFKIRPHKRTSITTAVVIPNSHDTERVAFLISVSQYVGNILEFIDRDKEAL